eukprot:TRINITY_DN11279_c0_g1_i1.p1 TRINITY_DN11279_c0_g1~~TRINITY_DN11279_c0_g1_i1.p1  ORF type:complete len:387 (+),score=62.27 TRINITY_DN11279_c0_g1_i1:109-1161(+)
MFEWMPRADYAMPYSSTLSGDEHLDFSKAPSFFIIGTQKGGTTALYYLLVNHDQITHELKKENHYFDVLSDSDRALFENVTHSQLSQPERLNSVLRGYLGNLSFSQAHAERTNSAAAVLYGLDATPSKMVTPYAARFVHHINPKAKIIVMLRDPVKRAMSGFNMLFTRKENNLKHLLTQNTRRRAVVDVLVKNEVKLINKCFHDPSSPCSKSPYKFQCCIMDEIQTLGLYNFKEFNGFVWRGLYSEQIKTWLEQFPRENIHFLCSEDFHSDPKKETQKILRFLGLPPMTNDSDYVPQRMFRGYYPKEDPVFNSTKRLLADLYEPFNQELFTMIGKRCDGWESFKELSAKE